MEDAGKTLTAEGEACLAALARALHLSPQALAADPIGGKLAALIVHRDGTNFTREDPVREITARLGDRWSSLLLFALDAGTMGHAKLRRVICAISAEKQISQRMLTLRLRALERDGLVIRAVTPSVPPRVDYTLTPLGRELLDLMRSIVGWIERNEPEIHAARARFAVEEPRRKSGGW